MKDFQTAVSYVGYPGDRKYESTKPAHFYASVTLHSGFVLVEGGVTLLNVKYDWFEESVNHTVTASFERTLRR